MTSYGIFGIFGVLAFLGGVIALGLVLARKPEGGRAPLALALVAVLVGTAHYCFSLDRRQAVRADITATIPLFLLVAAALWQLVRARRD